MAEKRPLCLYNGQVQELSTGDTLPGSGGGGSGVYDKSLSQPGTLTTVIGTVRWYPPVDVALVDAIAAVGIVPVGSSIILDINKNGSSIGLLTITAGSFQSTKEVPSDLVLLTTDYLTVDVDQVGSSIAGSDLNIQIQYTKV